MENTNTPRKCKKDKKPNWNEFYKNGFPQEVIVIDEDDAGDNYTSTQPLDSPSFSNLHPSIIQTLVQTPAVQPKRITRQRTRTSTRTRKREPDPEPIEDNKKQTKRRKTTKQLSTTTIKQLPEGLVTYKPTTRFNTTNKISDIPIPIIQDINFKSPEEYDDKDGHYKIDENSNFADRYIIKKLLGQGTFGKVISAFDKISKKNVAIKIIRSIQKYRDASKIEIRILSTLFKNDSNNNYNCIHLKRCFDYRKHICIVTDLLGVSVFYFLKSNNYLPFCGSHIQSMSKQLIRSVCFLHDLNLIHTDLKPENILLVSSDSNKIPYTPTIKRKNQPERFKKLLKNTSICLIDFGSAIFEDEYHSSVVSTRHYRAPEIVLGTGWNHQCDMWSIGCILVELFTGDALFQTHDNLEHLALMETILSNKIDLKLIDQCYQNKTIGLQYFRNGTYDLNYPNDETSKKSLKLVKSTKSLDGIFNSRLRGMSIADKKFYHLMLDLIKKLLVFDPLKRISAKEALKHEWFNMGIDDEGIKERNL